MAPERLALPRNLGFGTTLALVVAAVAGLVFTSCDHAIAESGLHGRWVAMGGLSSLDFDGGKFTKNEAGVAWSGTYVTDGDYITFHRTGYSSERLPFSLNPPALVVGGMTYYKDMPSLPEEPQGYWINFAGTQSNGRSRALMFEKSQTAKGSKWILEGEHTWHMLYRGEHRLKSTPVPGIGTVEMKITHINGHAMRSFVEQDLPLNLVELFGWEVLLPPEEGEEFRGWWFTLDETRALFVNAANKTGGNIAYAREILDAMEEILTPFVYETTSYKYTVERNVSVYDVFGGLLKDIDLLTITSSYGNIWTYYRHDLEAPVPDATASSDLKMWELSKSYDAK